MWNGSASLRGGHGFPWHYGPGQPAWPAATRHGYTPPVPVLYPQAAATAFRLILTGNPLSDPRPRGPWVTGPPPGFPRPAATGRRLPGGNGTDPGDTATWQRRYRPG